MARPLAGRRPASHLRASEWWSWLCQKGALPVVGTVKQQPMLVFPTLMTLLALLLALG